MTPARERLIMLVLSWACYFGLGIVTGWLLRGIK